MLYRVFNDQDDIDLANASWMQARCEDEVCDMICGNGEVRVQITARWDVGRELKSGQIACQVPDKWADSFGGSEEDLSESDFVEIPYIDV